MLLAARLVLQTDHRHSNIYWITNHFDHHYWFVRILNRTYIDLHVGCIL